MSPFEALAQIDQLAGYKRHLALIAFARSPAFCAAGLIRRDAWLTDMVDAGDMTENAAGAWQMMIRIHREAWALLSVEMAAQTPARAWGHAFRLDDRAIICRHLKIDPAEPCAFFATFPFRILRQEGERPWIAGAVGCARLFDAASVLHWRHIDITDVILWNPRSGEVRLAGETGSTLVECADYDAGRYTVFADGFGFFRAWADRRAELWGRISAAKAANKVLPREPVDSGLPGALVIGDLDKIHWRDLNATTLVAGPGIDPATLNRAVYRSARLPRVEAQPQRMAA